MIVVTDSGSTKADWIFAESNGQEILVQTKGLNPFLHTSEQIINTLREELANSPVNEDIESIYFYGAGCSDEKRCALMQRSLSIVFPNAKIFVEHDLLAAARALCGDQSGIACILGTGSNSCLYDGRQITDNIPSLGYLIGDEGSGGHLGRSLLRSYYYREMPLELAEAFHHDIASDKTRVFDQIYGNNPASYMASLSAFLTQHLDHPFSKTLIVDCFREFIKRHILKYNNYNGLPIHFVGSIAFHFQEILKLVLQEYQLIPGQILHKPIKNLLTYHLIHHH